MKLLHVFCAVFGFFSTVVSLRALPILPPPNPENLTQLQFVSGFGNFNWTYSPSVPQYLTSSIVGGQDPAVQSTISSLGSNSNANASGFIYTTLEYYLMVTGPSGQVPLTLQATGTANQVGVGSSAGVDLAIGPNVEMQFLLDSQTFAISACAGAAGSTFANLIVGCGPTSGSASFSVNETLQILTNTPYLVILDSQASVAPGFGPFSANAISDPTFTLPSDIGSAYSLVYSPGLLEADSVSPAPEPSTFGLFGTGCVFGAICLLRRRLNNNPHFG